MAIFLNNKVGFKIATVNLSDHVTAFTLNRVLDQISVTAMGDTANKFVTGLASDSITVSFLNDTAAGNVLATLQAAFGTTVASKQFKILQQLYQQQTFYTQVQSW